MQDAPKVLMGAIQYTPDDPVPSPFIAVSYPTREEAKWAAKIVLSLQSGTRPFESGPDVYVGDTKIKVRVRPAGSDVFVEVFAYAEPSHLTASLYAASRVAKDLYKAFRSLVEIQKTYTFTVAAGDRLLTEELDLLKYILDEKEVGY
ncbi:MAG: hypothetical protein ACOX4B_02070 [Bacillota bacterium]|jgi:hypothetical protein|nr:hypothetical protein [Candidatus Fermentithermobacillaceae bacterium]